MTKNQEVDGSPSIRSNGSNALCRSYLADPSGLTLERLKLGHVGPVAKVYSRKFIERCGVTFEETWIGEDVAFNVLAAVQARNVAVVPVPVYRIYRRPQSLMADPSPEAFLERLSVSVRLATTLREFGISQRSSAAGYMLVSFSYGPRTVFKTWRLCLASDLRISVFQIFRPGKWKHFLSCQRAIRAEKRAALFSRGPNPD